MEKVAKNIAEMVQDAFGAEVAVVLTRPEPKFGDFATNVALQLAGKLGRNPREIAETLSEKLRETGEFSEVSVAGPGFVNLRLSDKALLEMATTEPTKTRENALLVIETNNPNPFKAMHIGHAMNAITADAIANLLEASGAQTHRVSYHGDVGLHVGKSMWALLRYVAGDAAKLEAVPEQEHNEFMSRMYAEGALAYKEDDEAKREIAELTKQSFTRENPLYAAVYETIFDWSFAEIAENVRRLGNKPVERKFLESEADRRGVQIVRDNVPKVFQENDGALIFKGSDYGAFDNAFVSSSGQGLYAARDLGLMQLKNEQYHPEKSYIITAEEQKDYFKGVIAAANLCLPELKDVTVNISTGTLKLTTGKMSSRDGSVITIAWLFDQIKAAIESRGGEATADVVAGALRYAILKVRVGGDIVFDVNESVSIQGNSGPYLQYAHARACSILGKASDKIERSEDREIERLEEGERSLLVKLGEYAEVVEKATNELLPHQICTYLYELAQEFNRFYEHNKVIGHDREAVRLGLVKLYKDTLARGLYLLGIVAPEKM